jgi:transcriptional regulator GlxA family with amidase domain
VTQFDDCFDSSVAGAGTLRSADPLPAVVQRLAIELKTEGRRRVTETVATPPAGGVGLFERILTIISERYQQPLSIPAIARELQVSRVHVMRQFRKVTGMSVLDYITQQRVSCAQRLLATTDMKLLDIAAEAGFRSTARFYPCFKRLVSESPARYRRSLQIMSKTERVSKLATV